MNIISYCGKLRVFKEFRSAIIRWRTYLFGHTPRMEATRLKVLISCWPLKSDLPYPVRLLQRVASPFGTGFGICKFQIKLSTLCGELQISLYLPSLIYLHGTFSLRIFTVSVKNTPKILSIVFGCVTESNAFGFQIQYLVHYDQRLLEVLAILFQQF